MMGLVWAQAQELDGFAELRLTTQTGVDEIPVAIIERVRPTLSVPMGDRFLFETTLEVGLGQGYRSERAIHQAFVDVNAVSPIDVPANNVLWVNGFRDVASVDRFFVDYYGDAFDARIGRQALNWGSGFAVNPSDPFPEVLLTQPWLPRSGVTAGTLKIPLGDLSSLRLVVATDDTFSHPRLAGRVTVNGLGADWSLLAAWREEADEAIVGVDVKGTLGVGYWFEGVLHIDDDTGELAEEFVVGVDYSFPVFEQFVLTAQYYRNGLAMPVDGPSVLLAERRPFAPAFAGGHYAMGALTAGLTQDLSASVLWLQNLEDGTAFAVPSVNVLLSERVDLAFAAQVPLGLTGPGEFKFDEDQLLQPVPTRDNSVATIDFGRFVPSSTFIVWTRFNF